MLGRDQSPPTAILMYRLQHGLRSRPPSSTLQLGTPAVLRLFQFTEHLQTVQTHRPSGTFSNVLELHWEADSCGPPEAGPSSTLACPHGVSL